MHKAPGSLRPPPWLGRAIEDIIRAIRAKLSASAASQCLHRACPSGDDLLAVHEPTRIESFTERTEGMAHTTLLSPCPRKRGDAAQRLGEKRSKMHTKRHGRRAVGACRCTPRHALRSSGAGAKTRRCTVLNGPTSFRNAANGAWVTGGRSLRKGARCTRCAGRSSVGPEVVAHATWASGDADHGSGGDALDFGQSPESPHEQEEVVFQKWRWPIDTARPKA